MSVVFIGNWAVFIIYTLIVFKSVCNFMNIHKSNLTGLAQTVAYAFSFTLTMQASTFMALQVEWILQDNNSNVSDVASWGWMFYDYFNGFALLCFAICMEIYIKWHIVSNGKGRRKEDTGV